MIFYFPAVFASSSSPIFTYIPGAHGDEKVMAFHMGEEVVLNLAEGREVVNVAASVFHEVHDVHGGYHAGVRLSGGEDICQDDMVGRLESTSANCERKALVLV